MNSIFDEIEYAVRERAEKIMMDTLQEIKAQVDEYTPEDTEILIENNAIKEPEWNGNMLRGAVENETEYAVFVEHGRRAKPSRYYKKGGRRSGGTPFYVGYGAAMYGRVVADNRWKIRFFKAVGGIISGNYNKNPYRVR